MEHRVIVTGHSGVHKTRAIARLAEHIFRNDSQWKELKGDQVKDKRIQRQTELFAWVEAEASLKKKTDIFRGNFLYANDPKTRFNEWVTSLETAISELSESSALCKVLILNASFYSQSQFFSPLFWSFRSPRDAWKLLAKFAPTQFINFYDNIYFAREEIREPYRFSLPEILHWRNVELFITDMLASRLIPYAKRTRARERCQNAALDNYYPFERSVYFALGHPAETLHKLIFDSKCHRIYLSFPISEPKRQYKASPAKGMALMDQIDEFRTYMSKHFVAFDPLTIDELPLQFALRKAKKNQKVISVDTSEQTRQIWPNTYKSALCGIRPNTKIRCQRDELEIISSGKPTIRDITGGPYASELDYQVASRDFRLIDQSDGVIVYRPGLMKEAWDIGGTRAELGYASNKDRKKPVIVIHDLADGDLNKPPLTLDVDPNNVIRSKQKHEFDNPRKRQNAFKKAQEMMESRLKDFDWLN